MKACRRKYIEWGAAGIGALALFLFFFRILPYHLFHREQTQLFLLATEPLAGYLRHPAALAFQELKGSSRFFTFLSLPFPTFFFASSCRIGRFVSGAFQGRRGWKYKVFRKNTTQRCGDFFENRRLDLLFPKPAAIPLHLHDNG